MLEPDQVHEMDCFTALPEIPDESVEIVLTDPPYPNGMDLFSTTLVDGYAALYQACKKARTFVVFFWNPFDVPTPPPGWFEAARHVWHKPDCKSSTHYESIVVWSKENRRKVSRVWSIPILDYRSLKDWKPHPTQKPVKLVRYLLDMYTKEGDTVLDPFVGSGTTIVAALQMGRHCIALEKNRDYAQIAQARVKELTDRKREAPAKEGASIENSSKPELGEYSPARPLTRPKRPYRKERHSHNSEDNTETAQASNPIQEPAT